MNWLMYIGVVLLYLILFSIPIIFAVKIDAILKIKHKKLIKNKKFIHFFFGVDSTYVDDIDSENGQCSRKKDSSISIFSLVYQMVFYGLFILFWVLLVCNIINDSQPIKIAISIIGFIIMLGTLPFALYLIYYDSKANK